MVDDSLLRISEASPSRMSPMDPFTRSSARFGLVMLTWTHQVVTDEGGDVFATITSGAESVGTAFATDVTSIGGSAYTVSVQDTN